MCAVDKEAHNLAARSLLARAMFCTFCRQLCLALVARPEYGKVIEVRLKSKLFIQMLLQRLKGTVVDLLNAFTAPANQMMVMRVPVQFIFTRVHAPNRSS